MFCNQCGHKSPEDARFCSACGAPLDRPEQVDDATGLLPALDLDAPIATDPVVAPAPGGMLVVKRGPNAGTKFVLEATPVSIGRHPASGLFLDDISVSRNHAEIVPGLAGSYELRDAGSLNGTYLNRDRIDAAPLANADEIQIGKFTLVFLSAS